MIRKTTILLLSVLCSLPLPAQSASAVLMGENGGLLAMVFLLLLSIYLFFRRKNKDREIRQRQQAEILELEAELTRQKLEFEAKSISLDLLHKKLMSERTKREELERSAFDRDRFLAMMSNEMRAPLNSITGLTHNLLSEDPREEQVEQLRNLQFAANDLVVYINDVLKFSNIEAGKIHSKERSFCLSRLMKEVEGKFIRLADDRGLNFVFGFDAGIPTDLSGDEACTMQILSNLLNNSLRQTKSGSIRLEVSLHELKPREVLLAFTVVRTDGGIGGEDLRKIFQPIQEEEGELFNYDSQKFSLAITKRLVELLNGQMQVQAQPGVNTQFRILLPFYFPAAGGQSSQVARPKATISLPGLRVLLVEDNKINRLVVSKMLKRAGLEVSLAANGFEALRAVDENDFDLILMDIQMPEMDGYRATAEIRRHALPHKRDIPIIALTASAFLTEKEKAVLFGMNDHVGKPFSPDELMGKIKNCLRVHSK